MQEAFLHYVWQFQYFDKKQLLTTQGDKLEILRPGLHNVDSGPDFSEAKVRIGLMSWVGNVEIHIRSSEWKAHKHQHDKAYDSVVLHVVWDDDDPVTLRDGSVLPTIELKDRVDSRLLMRYRRLTETSLPIPCARSLPRVPEAIKMGMTERLIIERLEQKAASVSHLLTSNNNDWEETTYQMLAQNFGFKLNSGQFLQLAKGLPYKVLARHSDNQQQVEAMLFGQAGFLDESVDSSYHRLLRREYKVLSAKYKLQKHKLDASNWKFLRMRPANFPTVRLSQFCALICTTKNLFSRLIEIQDYRMAVELLGTEQSDYWKSHYTFKDSLKADLTAMGSTSIDNLIINTVVPILVAYGRHHNECSFLEKAQRILEAVPPENNRILRLWEELGMNAKNGFASQALIQLFNSYCVPRRCLDCAMGASLLKPH